MRAFVVLSKVDGKVLRWSFPFHHTNVYGSEEAFQEARLRVSKMETEAKGNKLYGLLLDRFDNRTADDMYAEAVAAKSLFTKDGWPISETIMKEDNPNEIDFDKTFEWIGKTILEIKPGDTVALKAGGGPEMVVGRITEDAKAVVYYMNRNDELKVYSIWIDALRKV
jgi:hypothetical protein